MTSDRLYDAAEVETVAAILARSHRPRLVAQGAVSIAVEVLDALTSTGWVPLHRVTCYEVSGEGCHAPEDVTLIYGGHL